MKQKIKDNERDDVSHTLEIRELVCKIPYDLCPRKDANKGLELQRAVQQAGEVYRKNKTKENFCKWQETENELAWFYGQTPLKCHK